MYNVVLKLGRKYLQVVTHMFFFSVFVTVIPTVYILLEYFDFSLNAVTVVCN